jgi:hypothetical protein
MLEARSNFQTASYCKKRGIKWLMATFSFRKRMPEIQNFILIIIKGIYDKPPPPQGEGGFLTQYFFYGVVVVAFLA